MYIIDWQHLTPELFLAEFWQKKPLLIKGGFKQFNDPIDANELAGLAMEQEVESRIVEHQNFTHWQVQHGPFEDFSQFGEQNWSLLVQAVNNWHPDVQALLTPFNFIPHWRLDDVMVSFSTPNGTVGAHLDQYDVFIIQGSGERRWQVGLPDASLETLLPHEDLKQVSPFEPVIDEITKAGDILYIPPNHPHNGVAISNALNFSVGFQAPKASELWSNFADVLLDKACAEQRFSDPNRAVTASPYALSNNDLAQLKQFMLQSFEQQNFAEIMGCYLTQNHHELDLQVPEPSYSFTEIEQALKQGESLAIVLGIKRLYHDSNALFINGEMFTIDNEQLSFAKILSTSDHLTYQDIKSSLDCLKNQQLLTSVVNKGFWYFVA